MKKLKIWYEYFVRGRTKFVFSILKLEGISYGGKILKVERYEIIKNNYDLPILYKYVETYWNPLKKFISREALPHSLEYGSTNNSLYTTAWFKVKNVEEYSVRGIRIIEKLKWNLPFIQVLNNLFTVQK